MARSESSIQKDVIKWTQQASVRNKYPCLKLLFHIPNERKCDARQGKQLKLMGVKRGVPDLFLPVASGRYNGLFIEMKTEKGEVSADQNWWLENLTEQGYMCAVCYGFDQTVNTILYYLEDVPNDY
jgi:hypothetical protein